MKRAELVTTLERLKPVLATTNVVPVFQCFMFDKDTVLATNDEVAVFGKYDGGNEPFSFAVNGNILLGLLQNSKATEIKFARDDHDIMITAGRSTFKLPYFKKDEFLFKAPAIANFETVLPIDVELIGGLQACLLTVGNDASQPKLMGITVKEGKTLYSCDGDAVTRSTQRVQPNTTPVRVLPTLFCETVVKLVLAVGGTKCDFCIDKEWAVAYIDTQYQVWGRLLKIEKPIDYEELITKTLKKAKVQFVPVPKGLDNALSRAKVLADPESGKTVLTVEADKLKLVTETSMGVVRDSMPIEKQEPVTANVSAALVQRAISLCDKMAILENCTVYKGEDGLYQLLSNMS